MCQTTARPKPIEIHTILNVEGLQLERKTFEGGECCELHSHPDVHEFYQVITGEATVTIGEQILLLKPGSGFVHIPPDTLHQIKNKPGEELIFLSIKKPIERSLRLIPRIEE